MPIECNADGPPEGDHEITHCRLPWGHDGKHVFRVHESHRVAAEPETTTDVQVREKTE